ncbi:MAG: DNA mismatch repair protein MutS [Candidatus Omnitrophica bacterium]|nr:DNA mismatch repair protein MutS [Candidatus Omnitrophota bacterium]
MQSPNSTLNPGIRSNRLAAKDQTDPKDIKGTPMLKQYHAIKAEHKDCILFFRLGDFYEMFFEDAKVGARVLDLVLTSRGKDPSTKVPMCGIPYHAAENYIARLIKAGYKVAICEQVEDPAEAKGIVKRDVTRIISSGTYLDENSTDSRVLICLNPNKKDIGISFCDPTLGTIQTNEIPFHTPKIIQLLTKLPVYECLYPESKTEAMKELFNHPSLKLKNIVLSPYDDWCFNPDIAKKSLCEHFTLANLHGFGLEEKPLATASTGALLEYLRHMNKQPLQHLDKVSLYTDEEHVFISAAAFYGLELNNLVKTLDHTITPLGRRKLYSWFYHPLKDIKQIQNRQHATKILKDQAGIQKDLKNLLSKIPDLEKNISRLSCGYIHAKDLLAIRNTLAELPNFKKIIDPLSNENPIFQMEDIPDLRTYLLKMVNEDIPLAKPEGKVICRGVHDDLDQLRDIQENGRQWLKKLQEEEIKRTGINSLKIGFNKVFGYYIEITKVHAKNVPSDYIRKQTLVNAERYITPQLKEYEEKILTAQDKIINIENRLIHEIRQEILNQSLALHQYCENLATLDVLYSFCVLAQSPNYIVPTVTQESVIDIKEGRHPFVEKNTEYPFTANDTLLDCEENHLIILTGPNMAGKSTYIRQTAILVIMAQVGSFIPAQSARVGIVDKIFTRIGAHDDISKGQSTFMVEMNETADILNNVTDRSLVILDEIGRGTSTYDGLSLAWALAEHLAKGKTRTLFATHFHELTSLAELFPGVKNYNVAVKEWKDKIIFLHKIIPGSTDDSYGIYVAKLAGIPEQIIARARHKLTELESTSRGRNPIDPNEEQLNLFTPTPDPVAEEIKNSLENIDIQNLTPLEALNQLNELKRKLEKDC